VPGRQPPALQEHVLKTKVPDVPLLPKVRLDQDAHGRRKRGYCVEGGEDDGRGSNRPGGGELKVVELHLARGLKGSVCGRLEQPIPRIAKAPLPTGNKIPRSQPAKDAIVSV